MKWWNQEDKRKLSKNPSFDPLTIKNWFTLPMNMLMLANQRLGIKKSDYGNIREWIRALVLAEKYRLEKKKQREYKECVKSKVHKVMGEFKRRELKTGKLVKKVVTKKSQALAIALSQARKKCL